MDKYKKFYTITIILTLIIMILGATYAYLAATSASDPDSIKSGSTSFSLNLSVAPKYFGYTLIPMKDEYAQKAYSDEYKCKDKNGSGACYAFDIKVYDYDDVEYLTGNLNLTTSNISNLHYMLFDEENKPIVLFKDNDDTDVYQQLITSGDDLQLVDSYNVKNKKELNLVLVIWLSETGKSQNTNDLGTFNGSISFIAGKGGMISGNISSAINGSYTG